MKSAFAIFAALSACAGFAALKPVKFIAHGWDCQSANPAAVLENADLFADTALDGISLSVRFKKADGTDCGYRTMFNDPAWEWSDVTNLVPTLRAIVKHQGLKDSMLSSFRCPKKRLDWRDDAEWARFANNMAVMARLAKTSGVVGLMIDPEDYPRTKQFYRIDGDPEYDEAVKLARQRGREVFGAVFKEYPDVVLLAFWFVSLNKEAYDALDPMQALKDVKGLWPAFVDGLLDVIPPEAVFVDGNENTYRAEAATRAFFADACRQQKEALSIVSAENHEKYRLHHRTGAAIYIDMYVNEFPGGRSFWYFPPLDGSRTKRFAVNFEEAALAAEWVWLDGEKRTWIPWRGHHMRNWGRRDTWEKCLPGMWDAMRAARKNRDKVLGETK